MDLKGNKGGYSNCKLQYVYHTYYLHQPTEQLFIKNTLEPLERKLYCTIFKPIWFDFSSLSY